MSVDARMHSRGRTLSNEDIHRLMEALNEII